MNNNQNKPYWWPDAQGFCMIAIMLMCFYALSVRMFHTAPEDKMLDTMITILFSTCLVGIVNFLFGSSRGSATKDEMLSRIAGSATTPPTLSPGETHAAAALVSHPQVEHPLVDKPLVEQPSIHDADPASGHVVKALMFVVVLMTGLMVWGGDASAQAQQRRPQPLAAPAASDSGGLHLPFDPLHLNGNKLTGDLNKDMQALWQKIVAASLDDLHYAAAMAKQANTQTSGVRLQCINAMITLNEQSSGVNLKDASGNPLVKPDAHVITDVESMAEIIDNLSPQGPLMVSCAGAAQLAKTNALAFINALVTGAAGIAAMPIIPGL